MKFARISLLLILVISVFLLTSCSQNNLLQGLTKPDENEDQLELAQRYLDDGRYNKAEIIARDLLGDNDYRNDEEATVILGQALMGKAGLSLSEMITHLTKENPTSSSNFSLLNFVGLSKRDYVYEAADLLLSISTDDKPTRLSAGISSISAAVLKVNTTYNPNGGDLDEGPYTTSTNISGTWLGISSQVSNWAAEGLIAMADATDDENLRDSATSIDAQIDQVSTAAGAGAVPYSSLLNMLGF